MNNFSNATTGLIFNEIVYGFKMKNRLTTLSTTIDEKFMQDKQLKKNLNKIRLQFRQKVSNVVFFDNVKTKLMYDKRHKSLFLKKENKAYLRLHKKYKLSDEFNKKLFNQRCDSFLIKRRIGRFAYELKFSFK